MQCIWIPRGTSVQKPEVQTVENQLISLWQLLQVDSLTHLVDWYFPMVLKQEIRLLRGFFGAWQGLRSPKTKLQDFMNFWYLSHRQNRSSPCEFYKFSPFIAYSVLSISCVPLKVLYSSIFCLCRESSFISHFPWRGNSTTFFLPLCRTWFAEHVSLLPKSGCVAPDGRTSWRIEKLRRKRYQDSNNATNPWIQWCDQNSECEALPLLFRLFRMICLFLQCLWLEMPSKAA